MTEPGAVLHYSVLDTASEQSFDDIVALAAQICDVPTALVSLVDVDRQWFKARVGFPLEETDLSRSVCRHVVSEAKTIVIPDLTADPRTATNPLVTGEPHIRFYAGAPLTTRFGVVGALCVIDTKVRPEGLSATQQDGLERLGRQVVASLEAPRLMGGLEMAIEDQEATAIADRIAERRLNALLTLGDTLRDLDDIDEMTLRASEIVGTTLNASRAAYGEIDHEADTVLVAPGWSLPGLPPLDGLHQFEDYGTFKPHILSGHPVAVSDVQTDPRTIDMLDGWQALHVRSLVNAPVFERGRAVAMLIVQHQQPHVWTADELAFLRNAADRLEIAIARRRAELVQDILNGEIAHRLKNTLAIVQAVASQTLRQQVDAKTLDAFASRLQALGAAHDALTASRWQPTDLKEVICGALVPLGLVDRCTVEGPPVPVGARAALSTALLVHELATNAVKYGAFSDENGHVQVAWRLEGDAAPRVVLEWTETGGPSVAPPVTKGFGSKLIRMGMIGTGGSTVRYDGSGLHASFEAAADAMGQA